MKRLSRFQWLLAAGLLLFLSGNFLPIRFPLWSSQYTFEIGPWDSSSESVDIPLSILYSESVRVIVEFDSSATPDDCVVWALICYQYPTKGICHSAIRSEGQREAIFTFGWENVRLIPLFVTGFTIRLFYTGTDSVSVDVVVTSLANLVTLTGLGVLVTLAITILKPVIINRFGK
ncbi:MAG: hypothetical protein V3U94_04895 [Candidatus Thorarchaeota archaeon]